jgi:hypothetical protein
MEKELQNSLERGEWVDTSFLYELEQWKKTEEGYLGIRIMGQEYTEMLFSDGPFMGKCLFWKTTDRGYQQNRELLSDTSKLEAIKTTSLSSLEITKK